MNKNGEVGARVRALAFERHVTQKELAKTIGVSRMSLTRRLNGSVPFNDFELILLGVRLGVPVGAFFGEDAA